MKVRMCGFCLVFLLTMLWLQQPLYAQEATASQEGQNVNSALRISCVNTRNAPVIELCLEDDPTDEFNPSARPLMVAEDGISQTITVDQYEEIGLQSAMVIDPNNLQEVGEAGAARLIAATRRMARIFWRFDSDFVGVWTVDPAGTPQTIAGWGWDANNALNQLQQTYEQRGPAMFAGEPTLFRLLSLGLDQFETPNADIRPGAQRSLVVFSTGQNLLNEQEIQAITERARNLNVRIYTVLLGPDRGQNRENLTRLTTVARGQFTHLQAEEDLDRVWGLIAAQRTKRIVRYVTTKAQPQAVSVSISVDGGEIGASVRVPNFSLPPFTLAIGAPVNGQVISMTNELAELPVSLQFTWPEGGARLLQALTCKLTGPSGPVLASRVEGNQCFFSVVQAGGTLFSPGNYLIEANATDVYGVAATAQPVSFTLAPLPPTTGQPTPVATPLPPPPPPPPGGSWLELLTGLVGQIPRDQTTWLVVGFIAALVIALIVRKVRWGRRLVQAQAAPTQSAATPSVANVVTAPRAAEPDDEAETELAQAPNLDELEDETDATQPMQLPDFFTPAWLVHVEGGNNPPLRLALRAFDEQIIGRSPKVSDLVIDEPVISRRHCCIIGQNNEEFFVQDEGSAGGTFLNRRRLGPNDKLGLKDGDEIHLNVIRYRFELNRGTGNGEQNGHAMSN